MVSNALDMQLQELLDLLRHVQQDCQDDPAYQELRQALPAEWPL